MNYFNENLYLSENEFHIEASTIPCLIHMVIQLLCQ